MTEREQRILAERLAEGSEVFDLTSALELVERRPAEAEKLLRNRAKSKRRQAELARAAERLHLAARELR